MHECTVLDRENVSEWAFDFWKIGSGLGGNLKIGKMRVLNLKIISRIQKLSPPRTVIFKTPLRNKKVGHQASTGTTLAKQNASMTAFTNAQL